MKRYLKLASRRGFLESKPFRQYTPKNLQSLASGTNAGYLEWMEEMYEQDPESVSMEWRQYFDNPEQVEQQDIPIMRTVQQPGMSSSVSSQESRIKEMAIYLIYSYQTNGHTLANLDPLGIANAEDVPKELNPDTYNITESDMDVEFELSGGKGLLSSNRMTLRKLIKELKNIYCKNIGWEFMHVTNLKQRNWLREKIESMQDLSKEERKNIFRRLMYSHDFEAFCATKWPTTKRFGLEGCESLIPGLKSLVDRGALSGIESIIIGMPHRGRLNVLANVVRKPMENMFHEFLGDPSKSKTTDFGSGDVKYHLGISIKRMLSDIHKPMSMSILPNPSHLEAVMPLVEGKTRAKQYYQDDSDRKRILSIVMHGDAAFAGQGVVYESMGLSDLDCYTTGGTVHVIINNQIGFTTNPSQGRSSPYCSDLAKFIGAPVFHVNADDPDAVVQVCKLAIDFRQEFGKSVVIDLIGYRRRGHNEIDQPKFTQPQMYSVIDKHPAVLKLYSDKILEDGVLTKQDIKDFQNAIEKKFNDAYKNAQQGNLKADTNEWFGEDSEWAQIQGPTVFSKKRTTGVDKETFDRIGKLISEVPKDFNIHRNLNRIMKDRKKHLEAGENIDWGIAENLAYGTLLDEGTTVRISGQDVQRGTFSHRHGALFDQKTGEKYKQLSNIGDHQGGFMITNSSLSEYGILGFELGYSLESPNALIVWEAQFGDFANTAQVIFDQFISSMEQKWLKCTGLVVLLPDSQQGQGPEHSSARVERYLQLCDEDPDVYPDCDTETTMQIQKTNWQVINPTTPANIFHALRRQQHRSFRKPLIVMSPKGLLRHKLAVSKTEDFMPGTNFQVGIPETDELVADEEVKRVVFCSGKVYYDLLEERREQGIDNVAIVRLEQLAPFPFNFVGTQMQKYPNAELVWTQEEAKNYGPWTYVSFRAKTALKHHNPEDTRELRVISRASSASPASGYAQVYKQEQKALLNESLIL